MNTLRTLYNNLQNKNKPFSNVNPDTHTIQKCPYNGNTCSGTECMAALTTTDSSTGLQKFVGCSLLYADYIKTQSIKQIETNVDDVKDTLGRMDIVVEYIKDVQDDYKMEIHDRIDEIIDELENSRLMIEHNFSEFIPDIKKIYTLSAHIHFTHLHPIAHNSDVLDPFVTIDGEQYTGSRFMYSMAPATYLMQEWVNNCDIDGDGKIYGFDFVIPNKDKNKPMVIRGIEGSSVWKTPKNREHFNDYMNRVYGYNITDPGAEYKSETESFHLGSGGYNEYISE